MKNEVQRQLDNVHYGEALEGVTEEVVLGIDLSRHSVALNNEVPFEKKQEILHARFEQLVAEGLDPETARARVVKESRSSA